MTFVINEDILKWPYNVFHIRANLVYPLMGGKTDGPSGKRVVLSDAESCDGKMAKNYHNISQSLFIFIIFASYYTWNNNQWYRRKREQPWCKILLYNWKSVFCVPKSIRMLFKNSSSQENRTNFIFFFKNY